MNKAFNYILSIAVLLGMTAVACMAQEKPIDEIERMKLKYDSEYSVADMAPTVCAAAGVRDLKDASPYAQKITKILERMDKDFNGRKAQKTFILCADCIGDVLLRDHPDEFKEALKNTDEVVRCTNVMTMVTPVCYATIFTGAEPKVHGIVEYMRPVVKIDTVFDAFIDAGKKVAIVSQAGFSPITIFRERKMDYIDDPKGDEQNFQRVLQVLNEGDYDLIVWHDTEYDLTMHGYGTESEQAAKARRNVINRWSKIVEATDKAWKDYDRLVVFSSDHGSHTPEGSTRGTHGYDVLKNAGDDCYEDGVVNHFYRWRAAGK